MQTVPRLPASMCSPIASWPKRLDSGTAPKRPASTPRGLLKNTLPSGANCTSENGPKYMQFHAVTVLGHVLFTPEEPAQAFHKVFADRSSVGRTHPTSAHTSHGPVGKAWAAGRGRRDAARLLVNDDRCGVRTSVWGGNGTPARASAGKSPTRRRSAHPIRGTLSLIQPGGCSGPAPWLLREIVGRSSLNCLATSACVSSLITWVLLGESQLSLRAGWPTARPSWKDTPVPFDVH